MRVLYLTQYNPGSTSRMRGEYLQEILKPDLFKVVNTDIPMAATGRLFRSFGWRFKKGPLVSNINNFIERELAGDFSYDLVWIDKGVFVLPSMVEKLKRHSGKVVHFTPDPAFTYHRSDLFYKALPFYDHCITTKSYELEAYRKAGVNTILCSQGYDPKLHRPQHAFTEKRGVVFIGHHEEEREVLLAGLLEKGVPVTLAGIKWERFVAKHGNAGLRYLGKGVYGPDYAKEISAAAVGLGFLSKWVPELHTTRTFEIPACGTALATEANEETRAIFREDEAIFFTPEDLAQRITHLLAHPEELEAITRKGYDRITRGGYSYGEIMEDLVSRVMGDRFKKGLKGE